MQHPSINIMRIAMSSQESDKSPQNDFNAVAPKIVSMNEWYSKVKAERKTALSFREKMLHYFVELPLTAAAVIANSAKGLFVEPRDNETLRTLTGDTSLGLYLDTRTGDQYFHTAAMAHDMKNDWARHVTPKLTAKMNAIELKAMQESADHSELRTQGRLKPI